MKKNTGNALSTIIIVLALLGVGYWVFSNRTTLEDSTPVSATSNQTTPAATAQINGKTISLLVADTEEERELGLSGKTGLGENEAMIFVFDAPDLYEFWMKDMKFPLDIIWLDPNYKIVHIESNVSPETYPDTTFMPESEALYVIEAQALFAQKNNLKVGDIVQVSLK